MIKLQFTNLTKFNQFLKEYISQIKSFDKTSAVLFECENIHDTAEILEGIERYYDEYFNYV